MVGSARVGESRAARLHDGRVQEPARLASSFGRGGPAHPGAHRGGAAGVWGVAILQCGQPDAHFGTMDAHGHNSKSKQCTEGLVGV